MVGGGHPAPHPFILQNCVVPGTGNLSFDIRLDSTDDPNRTMVSNVGRAIVKKLSVKFEGIQILSLGDFDVFACYRDLWKTDSEKRNAVRQGIIHSSSCSLTCMKSQINIKDNSSSSARDVAIASAYRNKLIIPLDFEMLDSAMPYYQAGLGNSLCYEIMFSNYESHPFNWSKARF